MTAVRGACLAALVAAGCAADEPTYEGTTVYVSDRSGDAVLRYEFDGTFRDIFASGDEAHVDRPSSVRLGPDGHIYLAAFGRGEVLQYDALSTAMMGVFWADTEVLEEPVELAFHGDEWLVLGNDTSNVAVLDREGRFVREFGYPEMQWAHDFAIGPDGHLYVALDSHLHLGTAIQVWDIASGTLLRHFGTLDQIASATGLAFDDDGRLFASDYERHTIVRFDPASGVVEQTFRDRVAWPVSLELGPDRALYVVDRNGVERLDPDDGTSRGKLISASDGHVTGMRSITFIER